MAKERRDKLAQNGFEASNDGLFDEESSEVVGFFVRSISVFFCAFDLILWLLADFLL